jgi:hypothetical protein
MSTITVDHAVLKKALEALEDVPNYYDGPHDSLGGCPSCYENSYMPHAPTCKKQNAITALRTALAQQEQEQNMTQEDIIRMAREAGLAIAYSERDEEGWRELASFAALVAAAERAACADICDQHASIEGIAQQCAAEIRARNT